jgi:hypothetical protein
MESGASVARETDRCYRRRPLHHHHSNVAKVEEALRGLRRTARPAAGGEYSHEQTQGTHRDQMTKVPTVVLGAHGVSSWSSLMMQRSVAAAVGSRHHHHHSLG